MKKLIVGFCLFLSTWPAAADVWGARAGGGHGDVNTRGQNTPASANIPAIPEMPSSITTIEQASEWVSTITHPDPPTQNRMRAEAARQIVQQRMSVVNGPAGYIKQTFPIDEVWTSAADGPHPNAPIPPNSFRDRASAVMDYARGRITPTTPEQQQNMEYWRGVGPEQAAWDLGLGACTEHAHVMANILRGAGVEVEVMSSTAGHVFPVVNLPADYDPDMPWTWGDDAYVPDSWLATGMTAEQAWVEGWIFGRGTYHLGNSVGSRATLDRLSQLDDLSERQADVYRTIWERLPPSLRTRYPAPPPEEVALPTIERGSMGGGRGGRDGGFSRSGPLNNGGVGGTHTHTGGGADAPRGGGGCSGY